MPCMIEMVNCRFMVPADLFPRLVGLTDDKMDSRLTLSAIIDSL